ncbi:leucine-rich repeat domain-containing protein [Blautia wexlerae]|uniref:leucine-rich repeat domain-containing protein n=1 Tax=Blautia wexlerae TaxID=418240 RepID=UPI0018ABE3AF|nr:leucine-rich repeat domain-containing protein [Blautia wexlerae]MDB2177346.1 leucine-rich repeat protein [Blautia wexlerae]MDB6440258.1 leucine-rich repeat protein [Blautia wexlerae]
MKKKVLAFLLASTMVIEPFSVASAADFSDGIEQDVVQFSDDGEDVPEVENDLDGADQFSTDVAGEGENSSMPSENAIQMGDKVCMTYDDSTRTATIFGTGDMWDYLQDGATINNDKNPLKDINIDTLIIGDEITHISDYLLYSNNQGVRKVQIGKKVKSIGKYAFQYEASLNSVVFVGKDIKELGTGCFYKCTGLKNIELPDSITRLGVYCFEDCIKLETIKLSNLLSEIPTRCFDNCESLKGIDIPESVTNVNSGALEGCSSLEYVHFSVNTKINKIDSSVFRDCVKLGRIDLPESIEEIGVQAFQGCSRLNNIVLPSKVKSISTSAFAGCINLSNIVLDENLEKIGESSFGGCVKLQEISIPQNVTYISYSYDEEDDKYWHPFIGCNNLVIKGYTCPVVKKFYDWLPEEEKNKITFQSLGEGTHQFTREKVQIKEPTCTEKGIKAYRCEICGATKDEEEIPALEHDWDNGVIIKKATETEEGEIKYTCQRCNKIKTESIPKIPKQEDKLKVTGQGMKWMDHNSVELKFQSNIKGTYYIEKVKRGENAPKIDITQAGTLIEANTTVTAKVADLPEDEVDIYVCIVSESDESNYGTVMFQPISSERPRLIASTIKFGDNITAYIEDDTITFSGNGTIYDTDDMDIGDAEDIWWGNGIDKRKIKHVIFKEDGGAITRIGNYLLGSFENLKDVKLPNGLLEIGEGAFFDCNNLMNIDLPEKVRLVERSAFSNTGISAMNWPKNATSIPDGAFVYTNLKEFTVPEGVTEINLQAFYGCTDLIKISIPRSVTYIGSDVFANCRNLTIYGFRDSAAEAYAKANTIKFVSADYKVIFKDNGRTKKTEYVTEGQNATPPTLDAKAGYTLSWDTDYTNITEDIVINAVWTKKDSGSSGGGTTIIVTPSESTKYTVTFKDRGEVVKTEKVKSGDAAEYPFITRNGYKLSWDKDFSKITANITVNAVWTVIKPEKVTSLTAESGKKSIALSWDETEYAGYYLVYRKADSEKEYTQVAKTTKILWTDSKAVPGTQYSYKVVAVRSLSGKKYQGAESDVVTTKIGTPQIGDTYSVGDLNYKLTGTKEVTVTGLAKVTDTLVIPSSVTISGKVYKVTAIQDKAFYRNEDIVNVTIGNNVVNVGKYAFYQCSGLETVKFGKRVAIINTCAFTQCPNLENVTLPSSIRKIGAKAFYQCTSIKIFKINGSALEYVGKKGLAINKTVTLRLPKKPYSSYRKLIKASSVYVKTKFVKF